MNKDKKGLLIGLVLGDGHLCTTTRNGAVSFVVNHSSKQREYAEYKASLVGKALGCMSPKVHDFDNSGYPGVRFSKGHPYFRTLKKWLYFDRVKVFTRRVLDYLTPLGVALWYMDDGSLSMKLRDGKIHARELHLNTYLSLQENEVIVSYFLERWGIRFIPVKNKGKYRLRANTGDAKKLASLVDPYILPSMKYKTDFRYKSTSARPLRNT